MPASTIHISRDDRIKLVKLRNGSHVLEIGNGTVSSSVAISGTDDELRTIACVIISHLAEPVSHSTADA